MENLGNRDTLARFNISRNDGARIFHLSAVEDTILEHDAIYVRAEADVQMFLLSDWSGWARGVEVRHNLFFAEGIARYGHGAVRRPTVPTPWRRVGDPPATSTSRKTAW